MLSPPSRMATSIMMSLFLMSIGFMVVSNRRRCRGALRALCPQEYDKIDAQHSFSAAGLTIRFEYVVDRWRHVIRLSGSNGAGACSTCDCDTAEIASVEGTADDFSPASPVFQELQVEEIDAATREFQLFGRCGKIICSTAVRIGPAGIEFDTCTRHPANASAGIVSSTYAVVSNGKSRQTLSSAEKAEFTVELAPRHRLILEALDFATTASRLDAKKSDGSDHADAGNRCLLTPTVDGFAVTVARMGVAETAIHRPVAATMRWKYRIRRLDVPD